MEPNAVTASYRRWAPIYDRTFGVITNRARKKAVRYINGLGGSVLEVGIGTGLCLSDYGPQVRVSGVDYSAEMLAKAKARVAREALHNVEDLRRMDAREMDFPDESFDVVAAMHVLSVVPEPERVVSEMARICRPGGKVVIVNHFSRADGVLGALEKAASPLESTLGWQSDFPMSRVIGDPRLRVTFQRRVPPMGMMTMLVMERAA